MIPITPDARDTTALRRHYEVERELADRLRCAPADVRRALYRDVYDELFERVPDHPQRVWKETTDHQARRTAEQLGLLKPYLAPNTVFLEVGAGDCHLTRTVAGQVRFAYGVDVSDEISGCPDRPRNFDLLPTDGASIPLADERVSVAYSNMLLEHLHPDDAARHVREVHRVLAPGGVYVCRTPHQFTGPQDISQFFDETATGLHLKEYTVRELTALFRAAGFGSVAVRIRVKGIGATVPWWVVRAAEAGLGVLPYRLRKAACKSALLRPAFWAVSVVGRKNRLGHQRCDVPHCLSLGFA